MKHSIFIQLVKRAKQNYFSFKTHLILMEHQDHAMISLSFMHHLYHTYWLLLNISTCFIICRATLGMTEKRIAIKYNTAGRKEKSFISTFCKWPGESRIKLAMMTNFFEYATLILGPRQNCKLAFSYKIQVSIFTKVLTYLLEIRQQSKEMFSCKL